jgi:hypothetical protein
MQSRTPTKAEKEWMDAICQLGCVVCNIFLHVHSPAEPHHLKGRVKPGCHFLTIPLCPRHHRNPGKDYVSRADGKKLFERTYMPEVKLLEQTKLLVEEQKGSKV